MLGFLAFLAFLHGFIAPCSRIVPPIWVLKWMVGGGMGSSLSRALCEYYLWPACAPCDPLLGCHRGWAFGLRLPCPGSTGQRGGASPCLLKAEGVCVCFHTWRAHPVTWSCTRTLGWVSLGFFLMPVPVLLVIAPVGAAHNGRGWYWLDVGVCGRFRCRLGPHYAHHNNTHRSVLLKSLCSGCCCFFFLWR